MIDRLIGEQGNTRSSQPEASPIPYSNQATTSLPLNELSMYPQTVNSFPKQEPPQQSMAPAIEPQPPHVLQPLQTVEPPEIHFNDFNFDNIIGDAQTNGELPEFDFVSTLTRRTFVANTVQGFWGDPINFSSEPIDFPTDGGYTRTWTS